MIAKIMKKRTGNCPCINCGKVEDGLKMHPYSVYHKDENEKRGHYEPVCCTECARELIKNYK